MKSVVLLIVSLGINVVMFGQKTTCKSLRVGRFKITTTESGTTFITRTKTSQIEENAALGYKIFFKINWVDDCTYELTPKEVIKGDPSLIGVGRDVLRTHIKQIDDKSYTTENSSNFSSSVSYFRVDIIR